MEIILSPLQLSTTRFTVGDNVKVDLNFKYVSGEDGVIYIFASPYYKNILGKHLVDACMGSTTVNLDATQEPVQKTASVQFPITPKSEGGVEDGSYGLVVWIQDTTPGVKPWTNNNLAMTDQDNVIVVTGNLGSDDIAIGTPVVTPDTPALNDAIVIECPIQSDVNKIVTINIVITESAFIGTGALIESLQLTSVALSAGETAVATFETTAKGNTGTKDILVQVIEGGSVIAERRFGDMYQIPGGGGGFDLSSIMGIMMLGMTMPMMTSMFKDEEGAVTDKIIESTELM
jgi:hypothetical protein